MREGEGKSAWNRARNSEGERERRENRIVKISRERAGSKKEEEVGEDWKIMGQEGMRRARRRESSAIVGGGGK